jgi:hypothetical protein
VLLARAVHEDSDHVEYLRQQRFNAHHLTVFIVNSRWFLVCRVDVHSRVLIKVPDTENVIRRVCVCVCARARVCVCVFGG